VFFGAVFMRHMCFCLYLSHEQAAFPSLLLGVLLLLVGGGLVSSTIVRMRRGDR
jgi:dipeptide/tripeptide permease